MGVFDKIKNALFEVEYVEVDEKPKKEKKVKEKHQEKNTKKVVEDKPIAKKIVLPGKEEKVEHLLEEELKDEDFEVRPKDEVLKSTSSSSFKFMDDKDFEVYDEPKIVEVYNDRDADDVKDEKRMSERFEEKPAKQSNDDIVSSSNNSYHGRERQNKIYGIDDSYKVNVHEYGMYEKKDEKPYFKPSPIISPIYGILDKNYKKEDVVSKKEIRITSNYSRTNINVDDIRNKAFGRKNDLIDEKDNNQDINNNDNNNATFEVDDEEDNLLVDLSNDKEKPAVKEVTVGDAMEYFQDLGLEYNVDYVDASKKKNKSNDSKKNTDDNGEKIKADESDVKDEDVISDEAKQKIVDIKDESKDNKSSTLDDDDNLFDLIDSMYKEED